MDSTGSIISIVSLVIFSLTELLITIILFSEIFSETLVIIDMFS